MSGPFWLEDKHSGKGEDFRGTLTGACRRAAAMAGPAGVVAVWAAAWGKVAEADGRGVRWASEEARETLQEEASIARFSV